MVFSKDTTFLNLVRGERDHDNYGITHTIKHNIVSEKEKKLLLDSYKFSCRCCGETKLKRVVSLGYQPLANNLLNNKNEECELYPLELNVCKDCFNCQNYWFYVYFLIYSYCIYCLSMTVCCDSG